METDALKRIGLDIMGLYAIFATLLVWGDPLSDPGGREGLLIVSLSTLGFAAIGLLDWRLPRIGRAVLIALGLLGAGFHAAIGTGLLDPEIERGPDVSYVVLLFWFLPVGFFILATLHARAQPGEAGVLMILAAAVFIVARPAVGLVLAAPPMIAGALIAASATRRGPRDFGHPTGALRATTLKTRRPSQRRPAAHRDLERKRPRATRNLRLSHNSHR